jgi:hypothetical protein
MIDARGILKKKLFEGEGFLRMIRLRRMGGPVLNLA